MTTTPDDRDSSVCGASVNPCCAPNQTVFENRYGGDQSDKAYGIVETSDAGFVTVGETSGFGVSSTDVYLFKTDAAGTVTWSKTVGGDGADIGYAVCEAPGGDLVVAGSSTSFSISGDEDLYILRAAANGALTWSARFGGSGTDRALSIEPTSDGGFIAAGMTRSCGAGGSDAYVVKTAADGSLLWQRTYGGSNDDEARSIIQTSDGGYLFAGFTEIEPPLMRAMWLVKLDFFGNIQWSQMYFDGYNEEAHAVIETSEGNYLVVGQNSLFAPMYNDMQAFLIDPTGAVIWGRTYFGQEDDIAYSVKETCECTFVIAGYTASFGHGGTDASLLTIDGQGNPLSWYAYGTTADEESRDVVQSSTGGFALAGRTDVNVATADDVYRVKTDCDGTAVCEIDLAETYWIDFFGIPSDGPDNVTTPILAALVGSDETSPQTTSNGTCPPPALPTSSADERETGAAPTLANSLTLYPNPLQSGGALRLQYVSPTTAEARITVANILGKEVFALNRSVTRGVNSMTIPTENWPAGTYVASVRSQTDELKRIVIVVR